MQRGSNRPRVPVSRGVSYFGNRYPSHARADLRSMADAGATYVVHVMSEADLRWNPANLARLLSIGRGFGLEGWLAPWGLAGVFGGEAPSYAVAEHPDASQRDNQGNPLPALCPRRPAFEALMERWLDAAAATGATVVMWDEPHLALPRGGVDSRWACRCPACQEAFATRFGVVMPGEHTADVSAFVGELLVATLTGLVRRAADRGLGSAVVLLADEQYDAEDWRAAASLPGVRYFGTTPYWFFSGIGASEMDEFVRRWSRRVVAATDGLSAEPLAWVQAFGVPAGREPEIERAVGLMVEEGIRSTAVWSYRACEAMSELAADDPDRAWRAVVRAFASLPSAGQP